MIEQGDLFDFPFTDPDRALAELFEDDGILADLHSSGHRNVDLQGLYDGNNSLLPLISGDHEERDFQTQDAYTTAHAAPMVHRQQPTPDLSFNDGMEYAQDQNFAVSPTVIEPHLKDVLGLAQVYNYPSSSNDNYYDNSYLTPLQDQFLNSHKHNRQERTSSFDSETTYGSPNPSSNVPTHHPSQQGVQRPTGLSADNIGNLPSTLTPNRARSTSAGSKRPSDDADKVEERTKRARSVKGGYHCTHDSCPKRFDRQCDETKHYQTVHGYKPHVCEHCSRRFTYPKDVRRHKRQVHHIDDDRSHFNSLSSVANLLSKLHLWHRRDQSTSEEEPEQKPDPYILVTRDKKVYRKVCLKGLETPEALMREIGSAFGIHLGHVDDALLRHCGCEGKSGKRVVGSQLMAVARRAVAANKTLELLLTPKNDGKKEWTMMNVMKAR